MTLCIVAGSVTSTIKHPSLAGRKLLLCYALKPAGPDAVGRMHTASKKPIVAVDTVQAGIGDTVLVIDEGNAARKILGDSSAPIRTVVAAIVDDVDARDAEAGKSTPERAGGSTGTAADTTARGTTARKETRRG